MSVARFPGIAERLLTVLKPFSKEANLWDAEQRDGVVFSDDEPIYDAHKYDCDLTVGDLRRVRDVYGEIEASLQANRETLAIGLAKLDGVNLAAIRSTVGPADDANNWRKYLGRADDLLRFLEVSE